jgi:putative transposase
MGKKIIKKPLFVNDYIYHVFNKGIEGRDIFLDDEDRLRFIHNLFEFNDSETASKFLPSKIKRSSETQYLTFKERKPRKLIVEILAFCLMPNHFHLLLKQKEDNGIVKFMHKLGTGYTNYFNLKYQRTGHLFQGRFKAVLVESQSHFIHLPYYIHCNPLDLKFPEWRKREIENWEEALNFLENYRWSSYLDYIGKKNFPSVTQRDFLNNFFEGPENYKQSMINWLKEMDLKSFKDVILE